VLLKAHEVLMKVGEGDKASPGLFRKQPVRVGPLVPPPAPEVPNLMSNLEKYINEDISTAPLIKAGLAHVQFEIIHPFLDGNGRIGRLLIVLMLVESGLLKLPILYPSYYFKKHHLEYYQKLDRVRTHGDFEGWINYYLRAIKESAIDSYTRAKAIENLEAKFKQLIHTDTRFAKIRETSTAGLDHLFEQPVISTAAMSKKLGKAYNTAQNLLNVFMKCGLISENTVHKRSQTYRFDPYIELLEKDL
jgi:Fic family protein